MKNQRLRNICLLASATASFVWCIPAVAHTLPVHRQLVLDAAAYIDRGGTKSQKAALQQIRQSSVNDGAPDGTHLHALEALADEARLTDHYEDIAYYSNSKVLGTVAQPIISLAGGSETHFREDYVTSLQHFLNLEPPASDPTRLWKGSEGYYYKWSSKRGVDKRLFETGFPGGSTHVGMSGMDLEVDDELSIAIQRYKTHWKGSESQWNRNWEFDGNLTGDDWDIENTRFAPISALAYYWFRRYVGFQAEEARTQYDRWQMKNGARTGRIKPRTIAGIRLLAPALHALADVTVPQHTIGTCELGHQQYEQDFESYPVMPTDDQIARLLSECSFLKRELSPLSSAVDTLQVMLVTGSDVGAGVDTDLRIDLGPSQSYVLSSPLEETERWFDDVYTLAVKPGTKVADFTQVRIHRGKNGSDWQLKAIYMVVNGVVLYAKPNANKWLKKGEAWTAPDFTRRADRP